MSRGKKIKQGDVKEWYYSEKVKQHFFHPQNVLLRDPKKGEFDAEGFVGSPACGDIMRMWIKLERKPASAKVSARQRRIKKLKWRTFGCASAIASTSVFSEMVTRGGGLTIEQALKIKPQDIIKELGGLPKIKIHCSVLADQAFKKTIENLQN